MTDTPGRADGELARVEDQLRATAEDAERHIDARGDAVLARHERVAFGFRLLRTVMKEQGQEQVGLAASGAAFWLIISALPTAIAAISIFGLIVKPADVATDLAGLTHAGPASLGATATTQLQRVAASDHVGLSTGLVVSLVLALWSASAGVYNLDRAIRTAYGLRPQRYLDARGRAFVGAILAVVALGLIALLSAGMSGVLAHVPSAVVAIAGIPALLVFMVFAIAGLYRFSIARSVGAAAVLPGAVASACGLALVAAGLATYLDVSKHFTAVYGALAGAVIVMIGTYLAVYVVLLGAVLNVQLTGVAFHELDDLGLNPRSKRARP